MALVIAAEWTADSDPQPTVIHLPQSLNCLSWLVTVSYSRPFNSLMASIIQLAAGVGEPGAGAPCVGARVIPSVTLHRPQGAVWRQVPAHQLCGAAVRARLLCAFCFECPAVAAFVAHDYLLQHCAATHQQRSIRIEYMLQLRVTTTCSSLLT